MAESLPTRFRRRLRVMTSYSSSSARGLQLVFGLFCGGHLGGYASGQSTVEDHLREKRNSVVPGRWCPPECHQCGDTTGGVRLWLSSESCARLGGIDGQVSEAIGLVAVPPVLLGTGTASGRGEPAGPGRIWQVIDRTVTVSEPEKTPASESQ